MVSTGVSGQLKRAAVETVVDSTRQQALLSSGRAAHFGPVNPRRSRTINIGLAFTSP